MGQCVTKDGEDQNSITANQLRPAPQTMNRTYSSKLLNPNITNVVILEEESYLQESSLYSLYSVMEENSANRSTLASAISKVRPLGHAITQSVVIQIINVSNGRRLHSHAVKCDKKQHEVSLCNEVEKNAYDEWYILTNHNETVRDGDIVAIQHKLTKCILRSSSGVMTKSKLQQVSCVDVQQELMEDDYWIIEIVNESKQVNKLHSNNLIRIRHAHTNSYLSGTKNKAIIKGHMEICVSQSPGHDIWVVEDMF